MLLEIPCTINDTKQTYTNQSELHIWAFSFKTIGLSGPRMGWPIGVIFLPYHVYGIYLDDDDYCTPFGGDSGE